MEAWHANSPRQGGDKGFGLVEQLMTLAVLAVVTAIAVPSFRRMMVGHELRAAQTDYMAALNHARNLAVNEQVRVVLCPSRDALTCNGDNDWQSGWLVARDPDSKKQPEGPPLYVGNRYSDAIRIVGSERTHFWFRPDGTSGGTLQRLVFCTRERSPRVLVLRVARQGRIRAAAPDAEDVAKCGAEG